MEKIQGVKNLATRGVGDFVKFYVAPPPKCVLPLKCPPQIPRPGAATADDKQRNKKLMLSVLN